MSSHKTQADVLVTRGQALLARGNLPAATDLLNQAVKLYWAVGEYYSAAAQTGNYGWALRRKGRPDLAKPYLEQAAALFEQIGLKDFAERHRAAANDVAADLTPEFMASLPPAVRGALERADNAGLQFALDSLPTAEQQIIYERLTAAGIISDASQEVEQVLAQFEPLLQGIATVARGDATDRADIEIALADLERKGWRIGRAVQKIWQGERRLNPLTNNLDTVDVALVKRILELI